MLDLVAERASQVAELCRRFDVARLEVFGSASHGRGFDPARSDVDLLVEFKSPAAGFRNFMDLRDELQALLGRPVDLVDRGAVEQSRNHIRRRSILRDAELLYAA
ncbi:MAG: nucleotidyltransferase domain-containing protein [Phenylobacterium sp.]|nr:nucleotidyltransferase domain-containing protein [Phenylobacterium sp.]